MPQRDWKEEVEQNLAELEQRQKSILHNPALARRSIERGVAIALVVVLTWYCGGLRGISQEGRYVLFACSLIGALVATVLVAIGVNALLQQSKQPSTAPTDRIEPPAIGW